jgi:hypothetical protein
MGLALLANLSAHDFGYISTGQLIKRTANAFHTMKTLERYRGHFYNWYDTRSLKPLQPRYVSTVDSGNLAAHLLTLRQGLLALPDHKILNARLFHGLSDTLQVLVDALEIEELAGDSAELAEVSLPKGSPTRLTAEGLAEVLAQLQKDLESAYTSPPTSLAAARLCLDQLTTSAEELLSRIENSNIHPGDQAAWWARAFASQCRAALNELTLLAPLSDCSIDDIPTLRDSARLGSDMPQRGSRPSNGCIAV